VLGCHSHYDADTNLNADVIDVIGKVDGEFSFITIEYSEEFQKRDDG
tara:strand:+ start:257 stop:397 length:141 start_codon:yes stop_codon:yes gene_type:complete